jgi:3-oxoacyl-[acyl-carrier protein] reductase
LELSLKSKHVLIAGGSGGIGSAVSKAFLQEGATVHIISRTRPDFLVSGMFWYGCDITQKPQMEKVSAEIIKNTDGRLDVLVCNVGSGSGEASALPGEAEWQRIWHLNFSGTLNCLQYFEEALIKAKGNAILVSSIAGMESIDAPTAYAVAKSALITLGKELSRKWAPAVRVNTVAPGNIIAEGGTWDNKMKANPDAVRQMLEKQVPLQRFGKPKEVADLILFLSSEKAAFITGSCLVIDGGQTTSFH